MSWLSRFKAPWGPLGSLRRMAFMEHLGLGGQGDVWLARDRLLSRLVTVKKWTLRMRPHRGRCEAFRRALMSLIQPFPPSLRSYPMGVKPGLLASSSRVYHCRNSSMSSAREYLPDRPRFTECAGLPRATGLGARRFIAKQCGCRR